MSLKLQLILPTLLSDAAVVSSSNRLAAAGALEMAGDSADHDAHQEQMPVAIVGVSLLALSSRPHQGHSLRNRPRLVPVDAPVH